MTPSPLQERAIRAIIEWFTSGPKSQQVFYLAGYAGTGKSTVCAEVISVLKTKFKVAAVRTAAYTAKAANVLRMKGVEDVSTIHALIYTAAEDPVTGKLKFILNSTGPAADADLIILEECSMVDVRMSSDVMSFGKKILVLGDPGQLPPVKGMGAFINKKPDFFLDEIHRQAKESPIIRLSILAREGKDLPLGTVGNVKVLPLNKETQAEVYREDTQAICGLHRVRWTYTQRIRKLRGFEPGPLPALGERVICRRNMHDMGLFNGAQGTIVGASKPKIDRDGYYHFDVMMDDLGPYQDLVIHPYHFTQHFTQFEKPRIDKDLCEFDWGYLLTLHNAQGSEYPHVTVVDDAGAFREDAAKWRYTSLTRAVDGLTYLKRAA